MNMDKQKLIDAAAEAVRTYYSTKPTSRNREVAAAQVAAMRRDATKRVGLALSAGAMVGQIALAAGLRQLLIVQFIADRPTRMEALAYAAHDADQYLRQVRDTQRAEAQQAFAEDVPKARIAERLGVTRPTVDAWLREDSAPTP